MQKIQTIILSATIKMTREYIWEVKVKNTPLLKRKCNRCNNDEFICSEKFRMNAQKKNIDVWLIYRCEKCDSTYNLSLFSRTKPELIQKDLFHKFSENNTEAAWQYAFSQEAKRKNNVEFDFGSVEYDILHDNFSIEDILGFESETIQFRIKYPLDFNLKLSAVIRAALQISANKLNQLIETETFSVNGKFLEKKHKVKNGDVVCVYRDKLKI